MRVFLFPIMVFGAVLLAGPQGGTLPEDEQRCREIPLGQISERVLEIDKKILDDAFLMKQNYEKMFSPAMLNSPASPDEIFKQFKNYKKMC